MFTHILKIDARLGQVDAPLRRFTGDGAYDTRRVYRAVGETGGTGVDIVVPPRRPATASPKATGAWKQRNRHIKRILGGSLRAKGFEAQQREAMVGCTVLNRMLALGKAQSSAVAE